MRAKWLGGTLAAGLAIATTVVPAHAEAKPGYFVFPGIRESQFSVKGTHGFEITVTHIGRRIELHAGKGDRAAIYVVRAPKPTGDGTIEATFPGVGQISVRFHPSGRPQRTPSFDPSKCTRWRGSQGTGDVQRHDQVQR